jgi:eukaryotic-like serine/threonine-protein kinase
MLSTEVIEQSLRAALPPEHQDQAPALAHALTDHTERGVRAPLGPELGAALRSLAGRDVVAGDALLSFGRGNNFGDITVGEIVGRDKISITLAPPASSLSPHEQRNRQGLIRNVRTVAIAGLERLQAEEPYLKLTLSELPDAVIAPPSLLPRVTPPRPSPIPPGTPLAEIFDQRSSSLLILGTPGSGKTVLLLELCRSLLKRAEGDERLPVPVVFNLASWSARHTTLGDWMAAELDTNFNISGPTARRWVYEEAILPLLDGLDEVETSARGACVRAINAYHHDHPVPLAVCAREADYSLIETKLQLGGAVRIQPLHDGQVSSYLERSGAAQAGLRQALVADAALREIAISPLMLSVILRRG